MLDSSGIAIATVHSILVVVDIVGNSLVCTIIYKNRDMRTPINYLLVNLAVADILYAAFITIDTLWKLTATHPDGKTGFVLCKLLTGGNLAWIAANSSVITMTGIAIERYYAIVFPFGNKGKLTKVKLKLITVVSWIVGIILEIPRFLFTNVKDDVCLPRWPEEWMFVTYHWIWFALEVLLLALMAGLYTKAVNTLWFKHNDDHNQLNCQNRGILRVRKRVTTMVIVVTASFGVCWLTDIIVHLVESNTNYTIDNAVYTVIHTIILLNSAVNPYVYALINQNFREKMKGMICCSGCRAVKNRHTQNLDCIELVNVTHPTLTNVPRACSKDH